MEYEVISIDSQTWRIENGFVRFFLLAGNEKAMLIDSGASTPNAKEIAESLTELPVELLNTHGDGDHTAGNGSFAQFYMHPNDIEGCQIAEKFPNSQAVALEDGQIIDLGGRPLEIIAIPGHTSGSVVILDVNNRVLYSGDSVQSHIIFMFGPNRAPNEFPASLKKLSCMKDRFDVIYASHGKLDHAPDQIDAVYDTWQDVLNGRIQPTEENIFGNIVHQYLGKSCGFYRK